MGKFEAGDTIRRTGRSIGLVTKGGIYVVHRTLEDGYLQLMGCGTVWFNPDNFELMRPEPAQQNDWSYAKADALLEAATKAIAEYNEYIQRKPSTYYGSISTVGTRIEPQAQYTGDE